MGGFILILIIVISGLGAIFWIIKNDKEADSMFAVEKIEPEQIFEGLITTDDDSIMPPTPPLEELLSDPTFAEADKVLAKTKSNPLSEIIKKLTGLTKNLKGIKIPKILKILKIPNMPKISTLTSRFGKKKKDDTNATGASSESKETVSLRDQLHLTDNFDIPVKEDTIEAPEAVLPKTGTASLTTSPSFELPQIQGSMDPVPEEEQIYKQTPKPVLSKETAPSDDLKEKYAKLQALFDEKASELENTKQLLENEKLNRKEFDKVKDLLESELNDTKEKTRNIQVKLNSLNAENESYKSQIVKLETKLSSLDSEPETLIDLPVEEAPEEDISSDIPEISTFQKESVPAHIEPDRINTLMPDKEISIEIPKDEPKETIEEPIVVEQVPEPELPKAEPEETIEEPIVIEQVPEPEVPMAEPEETIEEESIESTPFPQAPEPATEGAFTKTTSPMAPQDKPNEEERDDSLMKIFEGLAKNSE
ncbi:MAG: hypothetical protein KKD07_01670, partial [Candidatus Omnitrophica bacterium]|nr:hypothetical protein [Candidatus Omnitrophota bacterium]